MRETYVTLFQECVILSLKISTVVSGFGEQMKIMPQSFLCPKLTYIPFLLDK